MPLRNQEEKDTRYDDVKHVVSYSQFSKWCVCPWQWYLSYPKKLRKYIPSINTLFGTAMHETIQAYLKALFGDSVTYADSLNLREILQYRMAETWKSEQETLAKKKATELLLLKFKYDSKKDIPDDEKDKFYQLLKDETERLIPDTKLEITKEDMVEYYADGVCILDFLKKHRSDFFNIKDFKLLDIEVVCDKEIVPGLKFVGDLDVVLEHRKTGKIRIIDLKTSKSSWNDFKKNDDNTTQQLVLYKVFYADLYNVPIDKIEVEFLILKRKIKENPEFPGQVARIQRVVPPSGKPTVTKAIFKLKSFVTSAYTDDGEYNTNGLFPKIPTKTNCRFCDFNNSPEHCDKEI